MGWKPIKDIHLGDKVISGKGVETTVVAESQIYTDNPCYEVVFQDGTKIIAGEDHKWEVGNKHGSWKVLQTKELTSTWFRTKLPKVQGRHNSELLLDPYLLGLWLGDGSSHDSKFTTIDSQLLTAFTTKFEIGCKDGDCTYYVKGMKKILRSLNLLKNKHIPEEYIHSSYEQRMQLFRGLMDTDGSVDNRGVCEFVQKNEALFKQVLDLGRSLGIRINEIKPKIINGVPYYRFKTSPCEQIFNLSRKAELLTPHLDSVRRKYKNIVSVTPTKTIKTKCIGVDCDSHTFITRNYTVTHNTEFAIYMLWRHALLYPGSSCYYVAPTFTHGKELIWRDPRLAGFIGDLHEKYIERTNSTDCTVYFKNGSFIKIIGSENFAAANGLRPSFLVYDEFCEFHPRFHETMNPNRIVRKCPLLIIGTPPMQDSQNREQYMSYADECRRRKKAVHIQQSSYSNPFIDKDDLDAEKGRLYARGEGFIWESQYMAKIVPGGRNVIFPMFSDSHVYPHADLVREISNDAHRLHWYCIADPGTTTTMAILFIALNPYTKQIYVMDELYLTDKEETSVGKVMPRVLETASKLARRLDFDEDWYKIYDEAAAWFCNEVAMQFDVYFMPTLKSSNKKEAGISLMKDIFIYNVVKVSDKCVNFQYEVTNYIADKDGRFPRTRDHQIDCFTEGHEIYTESGWKKFEDLEDEKVAAVQKDGSLKFETPIKIEAPYNGPVYNYYSNNLKLCSITPNHRVAHFSQMDLKRNKEYNIKIKTAEELDKYGEIYIPNAAKISNTKFDHNFPFTDNELGYLLGNFCYHGFTNINNSHYRTFWTFNEWNNHGRSQKVEDILKKYNVNYVVEETFDGGWRIGIQQQAYYNFFKQFGNTHGRDISLILGNYLDLLSGFIDGLTKGDTRQYISSYNTKYVDQLGIAAYLSGRASYSFYELDGYKRINIYKPKEVPAKHITRENRSISQYDGQIYCVKVSTGMILVRKQGMPIISGNCFRYFLAAAHYSFEEVQEAVRHLGPRTIKDLASGVQSRRMNDDDLMEDWTSAYGDTDFEDY